MYDEEARSGARDAPRRGGAAREGRDGVRSGAEVRRAGHGALREGKPRAHEELSFELAATRYEVEYLGGEHEKARETFRELARRARTPAEIGRVYTIAVFLESNSDRDAEACAALKEGLGRLGFPSRDKPGMLRMMFELLRTRWALRRWSPSEIAELPLASDARYIAASQVVVASMAARFAPTRAWEPSIVLAWMRLLLRHGITPAAATALSAYAVTILGVLRDFVGAAKYVEAAQRSLERFGDESGAQS